MSASLSSRIPPMEMQMRLTCTERSITPDAPTGIFSEDNVVHVGQQTALFPGDLVAYEFVGEGSCWNWAIGTIVAVNSNKSSLVALNGWTVEPTEQLDEIAEKQREIAKERDRLGKYHHDVEEIKKRLQELTRERCEEDAVRSESLLDVSRAAVQRIDKKHWNELCATESPQPIVRSVISAVLVTMGVDVLSDYTKGYGDNWPRLLQYIRQPTFLSTLTEYDFSQQPQELRDFVHDHFVSNPEFRFDAAYQASRAVGPLQKWVVNQVRFYDACAALSSVERNRVELERSLVEKEIKCRRSQSRIGLLNADISTTRRSATPQFTAATDRLAVFNRSNETTTTLRSAVFCKVIDNRDIGYVMALSEEELAVIHKYAKLSLGGSLFLSTAEGTLLRGVDSAVSPSSDGQPRDTTKGLRQEQALDRSAIAIEELRVLYEQHVQYALEKQHAVEKTLNTGSKSEVKLLKDLRMSETRRAVAESALAAYMKEAEKEQGAHAAKIADLVEELRANEERAVLAEERLRRLGEVPPEDSMEYLAELPPSSGADCPQDSNSKSAMEMANENEQRKVHAMLEDASMKYLSAVKSGKEGSVDSDEVEKWRAEVVRLSKELEEAKKDNLRLMDEKEHVQARDAAVVAAKGEYAVAITEASRLRKEVEKLKEKATANALDTEEKVDRLHIYLQEERENARIAMSQVHEANEVYVRELCTRHGIEMEHLESEIYDREQRHLLAVALLQEYLQQALVSRNDNGDAFIDKEQVQRMTEAMNETVKALDADPCGVCDRRPQLSRDVANLRSHVMEEDRKWQEACEVVEDEEVERGKTVDERSSAQSSSPPKPRDGKSGASVSPFAATAKTRQKLQLPDDIRADLEQYRQQVKERLQWKWFDCNESIATNFTTPEEFEIAQLKDLLDAERMETARVQAVLDEALRRNEELCNSIDSGKGARETVYDTLPVRIEKTRDVQSYAPSTTAGTGVRNTHLEEEVARLKGELVLAMQRCREAENAVAKASSPSATEVKDLQSALCDARTKYDAACADLKTQSDETSKLKKVHQKEVTRLRQTIDSQRRAIADYAHRIEVLSLKEEARQQKKKSRPSASAGSLASVATDESSRTIPARAADSEVVDEVTVLRGKLCEEQMKLTELTTEKEKLERDIHMMEGYLMRAGCALEESLLHDERWEPYHTDSMQTTWHFKEFVDDEWETVIEKCPETLEAALYHDVAQACRVPEEYISRLKYRFHAGGLRVSFDVRHGDDLSVDEINRRLETARFRDVMSLYTRRSGPKMGIDKVRDELEAKEVEVKMLRAEVTRLNSVNRLNSLTTSELRPGRGFSLAVCAGNSLSTPKSCVSGVEELSLSPRDYVANKPRPLTPPVRSARNHDDIEVKRSPFKGESDEDELVISTVRMDRDRRAKAAGESAPLAFTERTDKESRRPTPIPLVEEEAPTASELMRRAREL